MRTASVIFGVLALGVLGCGMPSAKVAGRVTCQGKPVVGIILFSPKSEAGGKAVAADLDEDGHYELKLTTVGKHAVVITPRDVVANPKPGQFPYPCELTPIERDIQAGDNEIAIELAKRTR